MYLTLLLARRIHINTFSNKQKYKSLFHVKTTNGKAGGKDSALDILQSASQNVLRWKN